MVSSKLIGRGLVCVVGRLNLYGYCVRWVRSRGENVAPSLVPSGYHDSRIFLLDEGWSSWRARFQVPIAQSMVKRDHLVVLLRGTLLPGGWLSDATYAYAPESVSRAFGEPYGRRRECGRC